MTQIRLLLVGIALGAVAATLVIWLSGGLRAQLATWPGLGWVAPSENVSRVNSAYKDDHHSHDADEDVLVKLSDSQITAAGIRSCRSRRRRIGAPPFGARSDRSEWRSDRPRCSQATRHSGGTPETSR